MRTRPLCASTAAESGGEERAPRLGDSCTFVTYSSGHTKYFTSGAFLVRPCSRIPQPACTENVLFQYSTCNLPAPPDHRPFQPLSYERPLFSIARRVHVLSSSSRNPPFSLFSAVVRIPLYCHSR